MTWTNLFLSLDILVGITIIILIILIAIKTNNYVKTVNKNRRDRMVDFIRKTSKHNKEERKRLKF